MQPNVHALNNSPCTACCEPCHDVCTQLLTEGMALPCRALSPATPDWAGDNLTSALMAHPIRSDIELNSFSLGFGYSDLVASRICWQVLSCMVKLPWNRQPGVLLLPDGV